MVFLFLLVVCLELCGGDENEKRLIKDLLSTYDKRARPSKNASQALNVTFGLALAQLIDVVSIFSIISVLLIFKLVKC